jgi:hypothetical protein
MGYPADCLDENVRLGLAKSTAAWCWGQLTLSEGLSSFDTGNKKKGFSPGVMSLPKTFLNRSKISSWERFSSKANMDAVYAHLNGATAR